MVAILGDSAISTISLGWPWYVAIPAGICIAALFATVCGWLAVRTEGIYTIMITLAIASAFFYFTRQNYVIFNGFSGFNGIFPPKLFGVEWNTDIPFYYLTLFWAALSFWVVLYISRSPFGLALQGVRDNPRRMAALGFNVTAHRVAAYTLAGVIAALGGILQTWELNQVSPRGAHLCAARYLRKGFAGLARDGWRAVSAFDRAWFSRDRLLVTRWHFGPLGSLEGKSGARSADRRPGRAAMNGNSAISERLNATGTANALEMRGVSKLFGALAAMDDINLSVRPGERRAVLGSNGAGL